MVERNHPSHAPLRGAYGIRTRAAAVRGRCPRPLDECARRGLSVAASWADPAQAERVADQIDAGMVYVNIVGADGAELPFGGTKRSGFGRELGRYGADEFVNKKLIRIS